MSSHGAWAVGCKDTYHMLGDRDPKPKKGELLILTETGIAFGT